MIVTEYQDEQFTCEGCGKPYPAPQDSLGFRNTCRACAEGVSADFAAEERVRDAAPVLLAACVNLLYGLPVSWHVDRTNAKVREEAIAAIEAAGGEDAIVRAEGLAEETVSQEAHVCDCIRQANEKIAHRGLMLNTTLDFGTGTKRAVLDLAYTDPYKRSKQVSGFVCQADFCPFCGVAYEAASGGPQEAQP